MNKFLNTEALVEATKEFLRVIVLAILPVLIAGLEGGTVDPKVVATVAGLAALRWLDKLLHEVGKTEDSSLKGGLTRF